MSTLLKRQFREGLDRASSQLKAFSDLVKIVVEPSASLLSFKQIESEHPSPAVLPEAIRVERFVKEFKAILSFEPERRRLCDAIANIFEYGPTMLSTGAWSLLQAELERAFESMKERRKKFSSTISSNTWSEEFYLTLFTLSKHLFEQGLYDRASNILFLLITICPECAQFWLSYGLLNQKTRHFNTAIIAYEEGYKCDADVKFLLHKADCYIEMFNRKEAEELLHEAEKLMKEDERQPLSSLISSLHQKLDSVLKGRGK